MLRGTGRMWVRVEERPVAAASAPGPQEEPGKRGGCEDGVHWKVLCEKYLDSRTHSMSSPFAEVGKQVLDGRATLSQLQRGLGAPVLAFRVHPSHPGSRESPNPHIWAS